MDRANRVVADRPFPIFAGMQVFVYRNLNRKKAGAQPEYSLMARESCVFEGLAPLSYGRVFHYTPDVLLRNCRFVVRPAGYRKVVESGVKNVHAGVAGELVSWAGHDFESESVVRYNPFEAGSFMSRGEPVSEADIVRIYSVYDGIKWKSQMTVKI